MEFVVILISLIVVILQIVILANQKKNAKLIRELATLKTRNQHPEHNRDRFRDRKDSNFKNNRRNQQDFRRKQSTTEPTEQSQPSGAVENVEKSLRDINLKLKNAERDQEAARRTIQENIGSEGSGQRPQRHRNDGNRDGNRGGRDNNNRRDRHGRNNWRNRNNQGRSGGEEGNSSEPSGHPATEEKVSLKPKQPAAITESTTTLPELKPVDFDAELEHGRKVQVKRRPLKEETSDSNSGSTPEVSFDSGNTESSSKAEATADEIKFGRR